MNHKAIEEFDHPKLRMMDYYYHSKSEQKSLDLLIDYHHVLNSTKHKLDSLKNP